MLAFGVFCCSVTSVIWIAGNDWDFCHPWSNLFIARTGRYLTNCKYAGANMKAKTEKILVGTLAALIATGIYACFAGQSCALS